ncbi:unnamed protein product [Clonostachys rosea f. rosea IK726]|uniref:Zn(2)-C6 fungal-type domain-containing protein n=2 Tax=Bionectria ochroleuca TaxID=29856 RepID=A0A0B7KR30_BIOOC|nr:unnamed protein product [Clonostachys rosea f. rosea IK726]
MIMSSTGITARFRPKVAAERRKRVAKACTTCRRLKRKCIPGPDQSCRKCHDHGLACQFEEIAPQESSHSGQAKRNQDSQATSLTDDNEDASEPLNSSADFVAKASKTVIEASGKSPQTVIESTWVYIVFLHA